MPMGQTICCPEPQTLSWAQVLSHRRSDSMSPTATYTPYRILYRESANGTSIDGKRFSLQPLESKQYQPKSHNIAVHCLFFLIPAQLSLVPRNYRRQGQQNHHPPSIQRSQLMHKIHRQTNPCT